MKIKINKLYKPWFLVLGIIVIIFIANVLAQQPAKNETQTPEAKESQTETKEKATVEEPKAAPKEDYFSAGQSVDIKSENNIGDVAVAGANVKISGNVQGYVMAAGANVNIDAPVGNDLWAAGANVVVNAPVSDNAMLAGSSVILEKNGTIGNDVQIAANNVEIKADIKRNLKIAAATVRISSEVGGDVEIYAENVLLDPGAKVLGNLIVNSPNEPTISSEAKVSGKIDYRKIETEQSYSSAVGSWFSSWFLTFLWITVLGLVAVWFSSVWTNRVAEIIKTQTGKSFLVGLVVILAMPILCILLLVTIAGVPLALMLGALSLVAFLLSGVFVAYFVGDWFLKLIKRWEKSNVLKIIFGALIITFVMALPWIGWLAKLAVMFFGVGAFLLERRDLLHKLREQNLA
jgi:hypothetical protein